MKRAILIFGKSVIQHEVKASLPLLNYEIVAQTEDGMEALRLAHRYRPDLILMGWQLRGLPEFDLLQALILEHICPVIVILLPEEFHLLDEVILADTHQVVIYPFRSLDLYAAILQADRMFSREIEYSDRVRRLEEELKTRKLICQALLIIFRRQNCTEEEAYEILRHQAMSTRKTLRSVAQDVIKGKWLPD